jgi:membrane-anchored protein YejM (alkaline phosphatase superfamily)
MLFLSRWQVAWSSSGELREQYSDARALGASGKINTTLPANFTTSLRRHYYGAVSYIDFQVGKVLSALKANGQEGNTITALCTCARVCRFARGCYCFQLLLP